jgi:large subunit ribosomal protein L5
MSAEQAKPKAAKAPTKAPAKAPVKGPAKGGGAPPQKKGGKDAGKGAAAIAGARPKPPADYVPRLRTHYNDNVRPALTKRFNYANPMQVPRLLKVVVNMGVGEAAVNPRVMDGVVRELAAITGQRPAIAKARKSISNFKLREGMPIGAYVTVRRAQMWEFIDRLISVAAPRIRDFRGLPDRGFDGRGNYTVGLKEHIIFPEIDLDAVEKIRGMDITFVTTARTDQEAYEFLKELGLPMRKREPKTRVAEAA